MQRRRLLLPVLSVLSLAGALGLVAHAQEGRKRRLLHEDVKAPKDEAARTSKRIAEGIPVIGPDPSAHTNPTAIASEDKLLPAPEASASPTGSEPVHGQKGFAADRQTEARPDYHTSADNTLHYIEVFNPSIVPFKRMSALDTIREDYTLVTNSQAHNEIAVGGAPHKGRDLFWGSILVDLKPGLDVPIPSVSPDMRVLSYETEPKTSLVFSKDAADNFYLRTDETGDSGTYRVVFLSEAAPTYFAPTVPPGLRVKDIPGNLLQPVPEKVRKVATVALDKLRIHRGQLVSEALDQLVYYFRDFDAKKSPPRTGDIFWDLFENQAGVCRHRSFAFMVTANTLGIPTRYVTNEAHAWVEVWLPGENWIRIDLGGAANTLDVANASDKSMYRPRGDDPFAKPDRYQENYTRLEGDVQGLRDDQIAERQAPYEGQDGNGEGNGSFFGEGDDSSGSSDASDEGSDEQLIGPGDDLPVAEMDVDKQSCFIGVKGVLSSDGGDRASAGYRGESLVVIGGVDDDAGVGVPNLPVNIFLAPAGHNGNDEEPVGRAVTDDTGRFRAEIEIPTKLALKRYEVFATFNGNDEYGAAVSH